MLSVFVLFLVLLVAWRRRRLLLVGEALQDAHRVHRLLCPAAVKQDGHQLVPTPVEPHRNETAAERKRGMPAKPVERQASTTSPSFQR